MTTLRLRPWPFVKGETVELYWFCSPFLNKQGRWRLRVAFLTKNKEIEVLEYSWGILPFMQLGQKYVDGVPAGFSKTGVIGSLNIPNPSSGSICNGFEIPPNLYYLHKDRRLGNEKLWNLKLDNIDYYIPCIELVRSLFATSKTLTNAVLRPHGLDLLIESSSVNSGKLSLGLSKDVPKAILNDAMILHLSWLSQIKEARAAWDAVFNNLFKEALSTNPFQPPKALEETAIIVAKPPSIRGLNWIYRGIQRENSVLILELIGIKGLFVPFHEISYAHPSLKTAHKVNLPKKFGGVRERLVEQSYDLTHPDKTVKSNRDEPSVDVPGVALSFIRTPYVKKRPIAVQTVSTGQGQLSSPGSGGVLESVNCEVGVDEPIHGGEYKPIEFNKLEILNSLTAAGFEEFAKVAANILMVVSDANASLNIVSLNTRKKFAICPNGQRRSCAVLFIEYPNLWSCSVLEVYRPDNWSVSTLLVVHKQGTAYFEIERSIKSLIKSLISGGGHWANDSLLESNRWIGKVKHIGSQSFQERGNHILDLITQNI